MNIELERELWSRMRTKGSYEKGETPYEVAVDFLRRGDIQSIRQVQRTVEKWIDQRCANCGSTMGAWKLPGKIPRRLQ